ncbi:MAG: signal recognition particle-docking protein FtsY [Oscillospiraceae bacterium]|jgi:fused signal recognition particle receptor|nr:signal recognition particle-docking protein FtsY [Oscillospiraceae bacterium]
MGWFQHKRLSRGLKKTRESMGGAIDALMEGEGLSEDVFEQLEEVLIMSDAGLATAQQVVEALRERAKREKLRSADEVKRAMRQIVAELLSGGEEMDMITMPAIIMVIGVNGVGKTTSIGKLAALYRSQGKKVLLGAADTFRAAAIEQLEIWAERAGVDMIRHKEGADPAAVVFDTIQAGKARSVDLIICDTAGRLHNKKNLMDELGKIYRVIDRELPYSDREVLLALDATTGQNAVNQAKEFKEIAEVTGIILTKLDGTAKGGVVLHIKNELKIPVKFISVGEQIDDLQPFDAQAFAAALFGEE